MNKADLINKITEGTELSKKDITQVVESLLNIISVALASGNAVKLQNFGNFDVRVRASRKGRNPATGEEIKIPSSKIPTFKPAKNLKESVKQL